MTDFETMLRDVCEELECECTARQRNWRITSIRSKRSQSVNARLTRDELVLTSRVLPAAEVRETVGRWRDYARLAWTRNAQTDLVTFTFDNRDRLVGRIRHPIATLDREELALYLQALIRECDRFEHLLSGADRY